MNVCNLCVLLHCVSAYFFASYFGHLANKYVHIPAARGSLHWTSWPSHPLDSSSHLIFVVYSIGLITEIFYDPKVKVIPCPMRSVGGVRISLT